MGRRPRAGFRAQTYNLTRDIKFPGPVWKAARPVLARIAVTAVRRNLKGLGLGQVVTALAPPPPDQGQFFRARLPGGNLKSSRGRVVQCRAHACPGTRIDWRVPDSDSESNHD